MTFAIVPVGPSAWVWMAAIPMTGQLIAQSIPFGSQVECMQALDAYKLAIMMPVSNDMVRPDMGPLH